MQNLNKESYENLTKLASHFNQVVATTLTSPTKTSPPALGHDLDCEQLTVGSVAGDRLPRRNRRSRSKASLSVVISAGRRRSTTTVTWLSPRGNDEARPAGHAPC